MHASVSVVYTSCSSCTDTVFQFYHTLCFHHNTKCALVVPPKMCVSVVPTQLHTQCVSVVHTVCVLVIHTVCFIRTHGEYFIRACAHAHTHARTHTHTRCDLVVHALCFSRTHIAFQSFTQRVFH